MTNEDKIVLLASDGIFEFLSNETILKSLVPYYESKQIQQASDNLMTMATKSWTKNSSIIDDITFILIFISYNEL
jgi:serine/threonine protein phosphatase PrpC